MNGDAPDRRAEKPHLDQLRKTLDTYMSKRRLRSTEQRRLIVETFFNAPHHVTIEDLLQRVREDDPRIGYATVYRTMKLLAESGVAHERKFHDGFTRYEIADDESHHDHIICLECGHITEFEEPLIEELQDRIAAGLGFDVQSHKHELYAKCTKANCPNRQAARGPRR